MLPCIALLICPRGLENLLHNAKCCFWTNIIHLFSNSLALVTKTPEGTYLTNKKIYSQILPLKVLSRAHKNEIVTPSGFASAYIANLRAFFISSLLNQISSRRKLFKIRKDNCESYTVWLEHSITSHFSIHPK